MHLSLKRSGAPADPVGVQLETAPVSLSWESSLPKLRGRRMEHDYDIFEILPDGGVMWRDTIPGQENAVRKLEELSERTLNEVVVMHVPTNSVIASMKGPRA
jgi:hypothetical protein